MVRIFFGVIFFWVVALFFVRCANPVSPSGGPRDESPPIVLASNPANLSIGFDHNRITLTFNEFVKLKNPGQQVLISPPFNTSPEYKLRGKTLLIDFDEELYPNTTYTIFFGDAIVDLTEENPLSNYLFVFSTGAYIDSLEIQGSVVDAFNLQPRENVFAMLFPVFSDTVPQDSIPMKLIPVHVTKTDNEGKFRLYNLPKKEFLLFSLEDLNNNYRYDQQGEAIAFHDLPVMPEMPPAIVIDTSLVSDTLTPEISNTTPDSLWVETAPETFYEMFMFQQVDSIQRRTDFQVFYPPSFQLVYRFPLSKPKFDLLNDTLQSDWMVMQPGVIGDTLKVWVTVPDADTLQIKVMDGDSILDTLEVNITRAREQFERSRRPRRGEEQQIRRMEVNNNLRGRTLDPGANFKLLFKEPLTSYDFSNVFFVAGEDTMNGATFFPVNASKTIFQLDYLMEVDTWYEFIFPDSVFYNVYELTNDSVKMSFTTGKPEDYGKMFLNISIPEESNPFILQLMDDKEKILREFYLEKSQKIEFEYLRPGNYVIKAIEDVWRNRRWDTGIYVEKRQPEKVYYFPAQIQIRANWDLEEDWELPRDQ
jgi:hypothetical protein